MKPIKLRITVIATVEYEANPDYYPDAKTPQEMLAVDMENAENNPFEFLDTQNTTWTVAGEVVQPARIKGGRMSNLINCGTCGYPLAPEERTTLVEKDGVMVKPINEYCQAIESALNRLQKRYADLEAKCKAREWAGLTDEQIDHIYTGIRAVHHDIDCYTFARAIEAAHGIGEKK